MHKHTTYIGAGPSSCADHRGTCERLPRLSKQHTKHAAVGARGKKKNKKKHEHNEKVKVKVAMMYCAVILGVKESGSLKVM